MMRLSVLIACAVAVTGAAFVAGSSESTKTKPPELVKAEAKNPVVIGQKIGVFNMAKVMRDNKRAKTAVERLNAKKDRLTANLNGLKAMFADLQAQAKKAEDEKQKEQLADDLRILARQIEDTERQVTKILNDRASIIISEIHDEMHAAVSAVAREQGLSIVFAYPDAVTAQEKDSPYIKELKLKPPAAQPFYLDSSVDYSDEIIRRLNDKYDAENEK